MTSSSPSRGLLGDWTAVTKTLLSTPTAAVERTTTGRGSAYNLRFLLVTVLVSGIPPFAGLLLLVEPWAAWFVVATYFGFVVIAWAAAVSEVLTVHAVVHVAGGSGLSRSLSAHAVPSVVRYGLWWVPVVNVALGCYGWYLQLRRLVTLHDIPYDTGIAAGVVGLLPFAVVVLGGCALVLALLVDVGLLVSV